MGSVRLSDLAPMTQEKLLVALREVGHPLGTVAAERIEQLEAAIKTAIGSIERVYGDLPKNQYPGPPITILENLRTALLTK